MGKGKTKKAADAAFFMEVMEPRLLLSADAFGVDLVGANDWDDGNVPWTGDAYPQWIADALPPIELDASAPLPLPAAIDPGALVVGDGDCACAEDPLDVLAPLHSDSVGEDRTELVIIDAGVEDYQALIGDLDLAAGRFQVYLLNADQDGVVQISDILAQHTGVDAVHLVSHGRPGEIQLGDTLLNLQSLSRYQGALQQWADALAADADLLIYGCDLAADGDGEGLVEALARLTGTDVAASADPTGDARLGGDWDFEFTLGNVEAGIAFSNELQQTYSATLDIATGLVVHLEFEDGAGAVALDSTSNNNDAVLDVNAEQDWTTGAIGGAFHFDFSSGDEDFFKIPDNATVRNVQEGSFTLAAWFNPDDIPTAPDDLSYGLIAKEGNHTGLWYNSNQKFRFEHTLSGPSYPGVSSTNTFAPGSFYHVAVSVDRPAGTLVLYVNGQLEGTNSFAPGAPSLEYGTQAWRIGTVRDTFFGAIDFPAKGIIDDVRIYDRALSGPDANELYLIAINEAPSINAPAGYGVNEDDNHRLLSGISIDDVDAGGADLQVTLGVSNGVLRMSAAATAGLTSMSGNDSASVVIEGSITDINTALASLSYKPDPDYEGADSLAISVDDQGNSGSGGAQVANQNVPMVVNALNDAPTVGGTYTLASTDENTTSVAVQVGTILGDAAITAGDKDGDTLGIAVFAKNGNGTWEYSVNGVSGWTDFGAVDPNAAVLLSDTTWIRYVPDGSNGETADFDFRAWDQSADLASVNGTPRFGDTTPGGGATPYSVGASKVSLTVTNVNVAGTVSIDDTTPAQNQLLSASVSDADGIAGAISYQWFRAAAPIGGATSATYTTTQADVGAVLTVTADYTDDGGTVESLSSAVTAVVVSVNDAPVNTVPATVSVAEDSALAMNGANLISVSDVDGNLASTRLTVGNGTLSVTLSGAASISGGGNASSTLTISGSETDINATLASLVYQGNSQFNGTDTLTTVSIDSAGVPLSDTDATTITVSALNDAPVLINPIPDQSATEDLAFSFQFAAATFNDVDAGDTLSYRAQQTDGSALPSWLGFDAATRTFAGTPGNADVGTLRIEVIAEDGSSATVSDVFNLSVANSNDAPHGLSLSDNEVDDQTDTVGGHKVGDLTGADQDAGDVLTYSIVGGADQAHFSLANGDDLLLDDGVLDRAAQASYQVTIRVTDAGGLTLDVPVTVNVVALVAASATSSPLPTGTPSLPSVPTVTGLPIGIVPADAGPADADDGDADEEAEESEEAVTEGLFAEEASDVDVGPALVEETFTFDVAQSTASNGGAAGVRVGSVSGILAGLRPLPAQQGLVLESVAPALELQDHGAQGVFRTSDQMYQYFDDLRESLREQQQSTALTVGSSVAMTSGFSVGYVVWLLRGGVLASTVLSSLPAWQFLDPLPVLARVGSDDDEDEESLDSIIKQHEVAAQTPQ